MRDDPLARAIREVFGEFVSDAKIEAVEKAWERHACVAKAPPLSPAKDEQKER